MRNLKNIGEGGGQDKSVFWVHAAKDNSEDISAKKMLFDRHYADWLNDCVKFFDNMGYVFQIKKDMMLYLL